MNATAVMTSKGQITVPKLIRDILGLRQGIKVEFVVTDDKHVIIEHASKDVRRLKGMLYDSKRPKISVADMNKAIAKLGAA